MILAKQGVASDIYVSLGTDLYLHYLDINDNSRAFRSAEKNLWINVLYVALLDSRHLLQMSVFEQKHKKMIRELLLFFSADNENIEIDNNNGTLSFILSLVADLGVRSVLIKKIGTVSKQLEQLQCKNHAKS